MRDWRQVIAQWAAQERTAAYLAQQREDYPIAMWASALRPPAQDHWPTHLPTCQALQDCYRLCDGGNLAWFDWFPLSQLAERNHYWQQSLHAWDGRGDLLVPGRHVVLALDVGGCPLVWDATTDAVRAFQGMVALGNRHSPARSRPS